MSKNNFASRNSSSLNNGAPLKVDTRANLYSFKLISAVFEEITNFSSVIQSYREEVNHLPRTLLFLMSF